MSKGNWGEVNFNGNQGELTQPIRPGLSGLTAVVPRQNEYGIIEALNNNTIQKIEVMVENSFLATDADGKHIVILAGKRCFSKISKKNRCGANIWIIDQGRDYNFTEKLIKDLSSEGYMDIIKEYPKKE